MQLELRWLVEAAQPDAGAWLQVKHCPLVPGRCVAVGTAHWTRGGRVDAGCSAREAGLGIRIGQALIYDLKTSTPVV